MSADLFNRLSAVKVDEDTRITEQDRLYCEAHQKAYYDAKNVFAELAVIWEETQNRHKEILEAVGTERYYLTDYINLSNLSSDKFKEKIEDLPSLFISAVVEYFNRTYSVSIPLYKIKEFLLPQKPKYDRWDRDDTAEQEYHQKMLSLALTYKDILEQIFIHLGGKTFVEQAVSEIKEK